MESATGIALNVEAVTGGTDFVHVAIQSSTLSATGSGDIGIEVGAPSVADVTVRGSQLHVSGSSTTALSGGGVDSANTQLDATTLTSGSGYQCINDYKGDFSAVSTTCT